MTTDDNSTLMSHERNPISQNKKKQFSQNSCILCFVRNKRYEHVLSCKKLVQITRRMKNCYRCNLITKRRKNKGGNEL